MPLSAGKSKAAFSSNVRAEVNAGKPVKQAVAIAYAKQRGDRLSRRDGRVSDIDLEDDEDCALEADCAEDALPMLALDRSMRRTDLDGHLHVEGVNISKANVCPYLGSEIPGGDEMGLDPAKVYMLYRDAKELEAAAASYENKPLMVAHVAVSAETPQKYYIAGTVSNVRFVAPYLKADLAVWDGEAIKDIEAERKREISCGYRYRADMTPGTIDGQPYDGIMRSIVANHVALVEAGRAGPDVLVSDSLPQEISNMKISAIAAALAESKLLAADAKPEAVSAVIGTLLAADKKARDEAEEKAKKEAEDKAKDENDDPEKTNDEEMDDDVEDEIPDDPEGGEKKPAPTNVKDKKGKDAKKGMDAASVAALIAANDAKHAAAREVEPILGVVSYDSADKYYKAALDKLGVATEGVHASAYPALLKLAKDKSATPAPIIGDSAAANDMVKAIPGLARLRK